MLRNSDNLFPMLPPMSSTFSKISKERAEGAPTYANGRNAKSLTMALCHPLQLHHGTIYCQWNCYLLCPCKYTVLQIHCYHGEFFAWSQESPIDGNFPSLKNKARDGGWNLPHENANNPDALWHSSESVHRVRRSDSTRSARNLHGSIYKLGWKRHLVMRSGVNRGAPEIYFHIPESWGFYCNSGV